MNSEIKNKMTDLKTFISMLNNSKESFSKEEYHFGFIVKLPKNNVHFHFKKDESFEYIRNVE